jgi:Tol biopolymer transport system component/pimeloyl-ACP methyl ester carboxylesterase
MEKQDVFKKAAEVAVVISLVITLLGATGAGPAFSQGSQRQPRNQTVGTVEEGHLATDDGTRLFYQKVGTGSQTVIIPAGLFLYDDFKQFAKGRTLIFYDMRGRGRSDAIPDDRKSALVSIHHDVEDVERIRRHFKINKFSLIGYSYLGLMTVMYAMDHPTRVERIVQLGPVPLKFDTKYPDEFTNNDKLEDIGADARQVAKVREMIEDEYFKKAPKDYCEQEWQVTRFRLVGNPANVEKLGKSKCEMPNEWPANLQKHFEHSFVSVQKLDIPREKVAQVKIPVLTIHGTKDRNAHYGSGREWVSILPNARLLTINGAAHQSWADAPDVVFPAIETFLKGRWPDKAEKGPALKAENAPSEMLVVSRNGENQALLIDPANYKVMAALPVGKGPHEIAVSPDGGTAYVAISGSGQEPGHTITVLDLKQRTVKATFDLGSYRQPHDLRVSRDGALVWVTCAPSKAVVEIDTRNGKIIRDWKLDQDGAWMLTVTPDDRKIYTANLEGRSVSIIDRRANTVRSIPFESSQLGIDVSPDGREVWVHHTEKQQISIIDVATDNVVATMASGGQGFGHVKFTPDGKYVLVPQSESKNLVVFEAAGRRQIETIALSAPPKVITVSHDGKRAFITSPSADQAMVIDLVTWKETGTFPTGKTPDGIAWAATGDSHSPTVSTEPAQAPPPAPNNIFPRWSHDGKKIVFTSDRDGDPEIYVMAADGSNPVRLTHAPGRDAHPYFSRDGRKIVFQSPRANGVDTNIYVMDSDGSRVVQLTSLKGFAGVPVYSPDEKLIVFQWRETNDFRDDKKWRICLMKADGSDLRVITPGAANDQVPNWSRDGQRLIFFSDRTGKNQIYTMRPDGADVQRPIATEFNDLAASWSPDNKQIAFTSDRDGNSDVYIMDADGKNVRRLTHTPAIERAPVWSPDGKKIAFSSEVDGRSQIGVVNSDGSNVVRLTGTPK